MNNYVYYSSLQHTVKQSQYNFIFFTFNHISNIITGSELPKVVPHLDTEDD